MLLVILSFAIILFSLAFPASHTKRSAAGEKNENRESWKTVREVREE